MKLKPILIKGKKWGFHPSVLGLSISLFTASALSCLTNSTTAQTRNSVKAQISHMENSTNNPLTVESGEDCLLVNFY